VRPGHAAVRRLTVPLGLLLFAVLPLRGGERTVHVDLTPRGGEEVRVIVEFREQPLLGRTGVATNASSEPRSRSFGQLRAELARSGGRVERTFTRVLAGAAVTVRRSELQAIRKLPYVARVHEDRRVQATLVESVPQTRADLVWAAYGTRGEGQVVAVIDSGIDWQHAAFGNGFGPGHRVAGGWDFVNEDGDPLDDNGHGTHVAGIVAANGGGLLGVAPGATLLAYKVLDEEGVGDSSNAIAALEQAVDPNGDGNFDDRADVINISLGAAGPADDPLIVAVENAIAAGCVVVVSAGNNGDHFTIGIPAKAPSAITVGAIDSDNAVAWWSSKGPTEELLLVKPELVAPGVEIVSAQRTGGAVPLSGTSMAAPHVAGIAALLLAIHADRTPAEIKSALVATAVPSGHHIMVEGAGHVDALAAAGAEVLPSPAIIHFGRTTGIPRDWTSTATISLTNRSGESRRLELASVAGEAAGIDIVVSPAVVELAAGETKQVTVTLDVDNELLAAAVNESMSYGGSVTFGEGDSAVRVPWAFTKAAIVTVHWTSDLPVSVILAGDNLFRQMFADGAGPIRLFVPADDYDVMLVAKTEEDEAVIHVFPDVDAGSDPRLTASRESAPHTVTMGSVNEQGAALATERGAPCHQNLRFSYPARRVLNFLVVSYVSGRAHFNGTGAMRTLAFDHCTDAPRDAIYSVDYVLPLPLERSITLRNEPQDYLATPLRVLVPPTIEQPSIIGFAGMHERTEGGNYFYGWSRRIPVKGPVWTGTFFAGPEVDEAVSGAAIVGVGPETRYDGILSQPLHRDGDRIVSSRGLTPTPDEFSAVRDETVTIGSGPLFPRNTAASTARFFSSVVEWRGQQGDTYRFEVSNESYELYDEAGTLIRSGGQICCDPLPPAPYRIVGHASLAGTPQRSTLTESLDTRRADHVPPTMTMMRFVDAQGRTRSPEQADATLLFAVQDWTTDGTLDNYIHPMSPDTVKVAWRRNGTTAWTDATAVLTADDQEPYEILLHPPTGLHFRADLSAATAARAPVDIRITFADDAGNTTEWIGEAALSVEGAKRRSARH
jgi:hypothetical protein